MISDAGGSPSRGRKEGTHAGNRAQYCSSSFPSFPLSLTSSPSLFHPSFSPSFACHSLLPSSSSSLPSLIPFPPITLILSPQLLATQLHFPCIPHPLILSPSLHPPRIHLPPSPSLGLLLFCTHPSFLFTCAPLSFFPMSSPGSPSPLPSSPLPLSPPSLSLKHHQLSREERGRE